MEKGKFGISLWLYALLGFIFLILGNTLLCTLLLAFVVLAEKNEWVNRQVIQAFLISLTVTVLNTAMGVQRFFSFIPVVGSVMTGVAGIVSTIVGLAVVVLGITGIVRVCKGKEAALPLFGQIADALSGYITRNFYQHS